MKFIIAMITSLIIFSSNTHAFDSWCPQSSEVNYRATLAVDNINYLEDEIRFYFSHRNAGAIGHINGLRNILSNLIRVTDFDQTSCFTIQSHFYTADWQVRSLSNTIRGLLSRRPHAPVKSTWETFVRSFIELEAVIIELGGDFHFPRGPFYRRYFPGFRQYFPGIHPGRRGYGRGYRRGNRRVHPPRRRVIRSTTGTVDRGGVGRGRRPSRRTVERNPNPNPNRNINRNPRRNANRNPGTNRSNRRDERRPRR